MALVGVKHAMRSQAVAGARSDIGDVVVEHIADTAAQTNAPGLALIFKQTKFDRAGVGREHRDIDAVAAGGHAERLGFAYEGTFRRAVVVKGRNRDTAWFSVTDGDWQRLEPAFAAWLAPANFDALGRQRQALSDLTAEALTRTPSR